LDCFTEQILSESETTQVQSCFSSASFDAPATFPVTLVDLDPFSLLSKFQKVGCPCFEGSLESKKHKEQM